MEAGEMQVDSNHLLRFRKLPVWIIEHIWAHKLMDIQEVVDPRTWPDVDSQPLSIEDSWRLRVASARVFSVVKKRHMEQLEGVMGFLEATYRLLPSLVAPIKHMKILFGLKTMVIMWMLKEGRGMVDTLMKVTQFFPSKLPLYQDQSSRHDMFIMRKNNQDFKALAQALVMDKARREDYIKEQMETHYGEHYAQKVEDRLLHYLQKLEGALPGDTFVDKILKKESPVNEEEKLLLEVITSDSTTIARTLRKLLHCDFASCSPARVSHSSEHGEEERQRPQLSRPASHGSATKLQVRLHSEEEETPLEFQGGQETGHEASEGGSHSELRGQEQTKEDDEATKSVGAERGDKERQKSRSRECVWEAAASPHFCSKHQRWVKSILHECPEECSEELLPQASVCSSPPLFQSSSSHSSSQDLTPCDLIARSLDQQCGPSETAAQESENNDASRTRPRSQPASTSTPLPAWLSPVVRLRDIACVKGSCPSSNPNPFIITNKQTASAFTSPTAKPSASSPNTVSRSQTAPVSHHASTFTNCETQTLQTFSKLSRKRGQVWSASRRPGPSSGESVKAPTTSVCTAGPKPSTTSARRAVPQNSVQPPPQTHSGSSPRSCVISSASASESCRAQLRLSLSSQAVLLQSPLLQPYVSLTRLSPQDCHRVSTGRASATPAEPGAQGSDGAGRREEGEDPDSSFDVNTLYSSLSSSNGSEDSVHCDPDYRPCVKKKRLFLEYEAARTLNHTRDDLNVCSDE